MMENAGVIVAIAGFLLNALVLAITGTWRLSRMELALRKDIASSRNEVDDRIDRQAREFGETVKAVREKINEVELYCRDTFVRRDSFYKVSDDLSANIKTLGEKIDARLERMEAKIDSKT